MRIIYSHAAAIFISISLIGCINDPNEITLEDACDADKNFCEEIQGDSRCRNERKEMILARHKLKSTRDNNFAYNALINTEKFVKCAELAKGIEYVSVKTKYANVDKYRTRPLTEKEIKERLAYGESSIRRKNQKLNNYRYAEKELARLEERTSFSSIPELAHYHWTRHGNKEAIKKLVDLDNQGKINISWLQYYLSLHYSDIDGEKSMNALHKSLILYPKGDYVDKIGDLNQDMHGKFEKFDDEGHIHFNILRSLSSIQFSKGNYGASYIYAKTLELNNDTTADLDFILMYIEKNKRSKKSTLEDMAEDLDDLLSDGKLTLKFLTKIEQFKV
ncbi:DUF2989 domain-containing protein [Paraglaciecola sp. MB-3u-78]|uniref:DUF2989 domain-containing protein n=1 Tax=Paraglaciecola sp. MB-3u-78 TaxID=2058332 RepID=UPI000C34076E|nr:DUF2989 domain-containing protein [Paraglaciecola sp. MB-3u-78]PKG97063.1 hypothetical protein CXF95_20880 [Paraglaciecola sp. MB-3u-78]